MSEPTRRRRRSRPEQRTPRLASGARGAWALWDRFDAPDYEHPERVYRTRWRIVQTPWFGMYLHRHNAHDPRDTLHDHPWPLLSIVLRGGYKERVGVPDPDGRMTVCCSDRTWRAGSIHWMRHTDAHTIYKLLRSPTWTLLLVGRRQPEPSWGYWDNGQWVPHDQHPHARDFAAALAARQARRTHLEIRARQALRAEAETVRLVPPPGAWEDVVDRAAGARQGRDGR
jgi:hypothetical protein